MSTIQVRTKDKTKKKVQKILANLGLDMSSAINLYLEQIVLTESIPFPIRTANGFTRAQEQEMLRESKEAWKEGKFFDSTDDLFDDMLD